MCKRYHLRIAPNAVGTFSTPNPHPKVIEALQEVVRLAMKAEAKVEAKPKKKATE